MVNGLHFNSYHNYGTFGGYESAGRNGNIEQRGLSNATQNINENGAVNSGGKVTQDGINTVEGDKKGTTGAEEECETCKKRKYQDGSNENVSYKAATHISPEIAGSAVRAHEGEHVSNAYEKAAEKGGKVVNASVTLHTAICPECGKTYVSGGVTNTTIKYTNEANPYVRDKKLQDATVFPGQNVDVEV